MVPSSSLLSDALVAARAGAIRPRVGVIRSYRTRGGNQYEQPGLGQAHFLGEGVDIAAPHCTGITLDLDCAFRPSAIEAGVLMTGSQKTERRNGRLSWVNSARKESWYSSVP